MKLHRVQGDRVSECTAPFHDRIIHSLCLDNFRENCDMCGLNTCLVRNSATFESRVRQHDDVDAKKWCVSPSGVQTLADTRGQHSASVSTLLVVCEVGDRRWFAGDSRPGFYEKMVDDESERGGARWPAPALKTNKKQFSSTLEYQADSRPRTFRTFPLFGFRR